MTKRRPDREDRKQRKCWSLQDRNPACVFCGYSRWSGLERHHIAGRSHDDETVIVCRNCHSELSDLQRDHGTIAEEGRPIDAEKIGHWLLGYCDLQSLAIERIREFAAGLLNQSTDKGGSK